MSEEISIVAFQHPRNAIPKQVKQLPVITKNVDIDLGNKPRYQERIEIARINKKKTGGSISYPIKTLMKIANALFPDAPTLTDKTEVVNFLRDPDRLDKIEWNNRLIEEQDRLLLTREIEDRRRQKAAAEEGDFEED